MNRSGPLRKHLSVVNDEMLNDLGVRLQSDEAGPKPTRSLRSRRSELAPPSVERRTLENLNLQSSDGEPVDFERLLKRHGFDGLHAAPLQIFQVNVGKLCNMTCRHCHVDAGPDRIDAMMRSETVDAVIRAIEASGAEIVDITGGAPELHPRFRDLVDVSVGMGKHVIDRCNLTILLLPKFRHLPDWFAEQRVEVVASLPHHRRLNTDAQRGNGTYDKSIEAIRRLNAAGYGKGDPERVLTLMSNPAGAYIGSCQRTMEREWKVALMRDFDVSFDRLFALNNMPISRFLEWLLQKGNLQGYMQMLLDAFNPAAVEGLMCRNTLSVGWDGRVYDCDFNQMLDIEAGTPRGPLHIKDFDAELYAGRRIQTARHCFGCTAGSGSSCSGATTE